MLKQFGSNYIDLSAVVAITKSKFDGSKGTVYQASVLSRGFGCILLEYESEETRDDAILEMVAGVNEAPRVCKAGPDHDGEYVTGFREGVNYALTMEKIMHER